MQLLIKNIGHNNNPNKILNVKESLSTSEVLIL
jgi:hypothetical protein